ncbi:hypothetical protein JKP88DRAFT_191206 [Tribonema minus]|uniref:CBS domain-containing protein n=1 Tax=Tribonema minus TaxID=303371 RepID=A0A835ZG49_9STRA|nr:hypothetical protein JKP88DRAFT_191206 [Tribonema minus]
MFTASAILHRRGAGALLRAGRNGNVWRAAQRGMAVAAESEETEVRTAQHAWEKSCYYNIDYMIDQESKVYDAVQRMAAFNVGCLVVTEQSKPVGVITERDYVCKVALLGRNSRETFIKEVATALKVVVRRSDSIDTCVKKMITADVRHLPVLSDDNDEIIGLISVKDLVKEYTKEKDELLTKLFGGNLSGYL